MIEVGPGRVIELNDSNDLDMYDPNLWGPYIAERLRQSPYCLSGRAATFILAQFAFNLMVASCPRSTARPAPPLFGGSLFRNADLGGRTNPTNIKVDVPIPVF